MANVGIDTRSEWDDGRVTVFIGSPEDGVYGKSRPFGFFFGCVSDNTLAWQVARGSLISGETNFVFGSFTERDNDANAPC